MSSRLLTTPQAAALMDRDPSLVRRLARAGRLPAIKQGRDWLYKREDLEAFARIDRPCGRPRKENR